MSQNGNVLKAAWKRLPFAAEVFWHLIQRKSLSDHPRISNLKKSISEWTNEAAHARIEPVATPKKVLLFTVVPIWMNHSSLLAAAYAGMGHEVTLAYLPHSDWFTEQSDYQLKLRSLQLSDAFTSADGHFDTISWYRYPTDSDLPTDLSVAVEQVGIRDYQYTHQVEEVDEDTSFYAWRRKSNYAAAMAAYNWIGEHRPDVVVVPNGLILEFGVVYEVARYFDIPTVTYEFGEQQDRIWLAKNQPVMFQDTDEMWAATSDLPFTQDQHDRIKELYASRMEAGLWQNFSRQWQDAPTEGDKVVRQKLVLDDRPLVLMAANVIGDSLTLGRQVFSNSMTEWIERTLAYFSQKPEVQFVLRIHPGERYTNGPSVEQIVREKLPEVPDHIRIISANDPINTYDLISAADLGVVYTTTVGMEMAMFGLPAIVVGKTHYRGRGFTHDPANWEDYFGLLDTALKDRDALKISQDQVDRAWQYAHNFFFIYPRPFPWHLRSIEDDLAARPVEHILANETMQGFKDTFNLLLAEPVQLKDLSGTMQS